MSLRLGIDIGGTFTDCVALDDQGGVHHAKVPSTHAADPSDGVIAGLAALGRELGTDVGTLLSETERLAHGTTVGTNLLVERAGTDVTLVTTAGHGDALQMMRGAGRTAGVPIERVFDVQATRKPEPLVQRARIAELDERVAPDGNVVAPLDPGRTSAVLTSLFSNGDRPEAFAVSLLWSFRNPEHERLVAELLSEVAPDAYVSVSSETAPRQGEYERTVATVVNSYVGPATDAYLARLDERLREEGFRGELIVMQSSGGMMSADRARQAPIALIGSGPAGGISGVAALATRDGHRNVIATDMGGTSFEVGLIVDGRPVVAGQQVVGGHTFHSTHLDVRSIACGGGSIAHVAAGGGLRVGPQSAGSEPGPACYGRGGTAPTVTDADVVLGLLDPESSLGGEIEIDPEAARAAVGTIAEGLGCSTEEAAAAIVEVNNHAAATLIRQRTLEQGLDPRDFTLYAYGGAGPLHAFGYATELGVRDVIVPLGNGASTLSAYGIAAGDLLYQHEHECRLRSPLDPDALAAAVSSAEEAARGAFGAQKPALRSVALMRYAEQYLQALPIEIPTGLSDAEAAGELLARFDREYGRLFGEFAKALFQAVEVFAIRVEARIPSEPPDPVASAATAAPSAARRVWWPRSGPAETTVYRGLAPATGEAVDGPALVELPHTTVAVAPGQRLSRAAGDDSLRLEV